MQLNKTILNENNLLKQQIEHYKFIIESKENEIVKLSRFATIAEISAGINHEIAQPLTGIKAIAQNMIDDINYNEFDFMTGVSDLQKICLMVDKTKSIFDNMRSIISNTSKFKNIDLNNSILSVVSILNKQLINNNIDLIINSNDNLPKIYTNPIIIEQVLLNLIANSKDAIIEKRNIYKDEFKGLIKISLFLKDSFLYLTIEDNGIGIPPEIQKYIWSPFFTTKSNKGLGIGLSICYKLLKKINANIELDTTYTNGTKFNITFPIKKKN